MGLSSRRSPSTSWERELRRQEKSRSQKRDLRRSRSRCPHRRRSRSPRRHRSTSPSPSRLKERRDEEKKETKEIKSKERQITEEDLEGKTEEEIEMMKLMGFASFDSTKGKNVDGGFNRPLDFISCGFCILYLMFIKNRITVLPPCKVRKFYL
uniref:U4/U6.U5 small nuclear ribonucleoprotein 27 kDa protein n=1 Tax=Sus scrofa TaxID=9823 RepID=A0A8W4FNC5_PIG